MLKKAIVILATVMATGLAYGQGFVNFNTLSLGTSAQVRDADTTLLSGTGFLAQLYAGGSGAAEGDLTAKGAPVNFRTSANAGYVQTSGTTSLGGTVASSVQVASAAGPITVQLRAWQGPHASYEAALAAGARVGKSALLTSVTATAPPNTPPLLTGLQGFSLVPEPSTIALGVLGVAALLIRRRK